MRKYTFVLLPLVILIGVLVYFILRPPMYVDLSDLMNSAYSFDISSDGKTLIVLGEDNKIFQLRLRKAWDFNSIERESTKHAIVEDKDMAISINFNKDGKKLFITRPGMSSSDKNSYRNGRIQQFTMSTPFDVTTLEDKNAVVECKCAWPKGLSFDETGQYMQVVGAVATQFFNFYLESPYDIKAVKHLAPTFITRSIRGLGHLSLSHATKDIYYTTEKRTQSAYQFKMINTGSYPELRYDYKQMNLNHLESIPMTVLAHPSGEKIWVLTENAKIYTYSLENSFDLDSKK